MASPTSTPKRKTPNDDDDDNEEEEEEDNESIGTEEQKKREQWVLDAEEDVERTVNRIAAGMKRAALNLIDNFHELGVYGYDIREDDEKGLLVAFDTDMEFDEIGSTGWRSVGSPIYVYIAVDGAYEIEYEGDADNSLTYAWSVAKRVKRLLKQEDQKRKKAKETKQ